MSEQEMKLLIMLADASLDLDTITATMMIIKQKEHGCNLMIDFLNNLKEEDISRNTILRKAIEIVENNINSRGDI